MTKRIPLHVAARNNGVSVDTLERIFLEEGVDVPRLDKGRVRFVSEVLLESVMGRRSAREPMPNRIGSRKAKEESELH